MKADLWLAWQAASWEAEEEFNGDGRPLPEGTIAQFNEFYRQQFEKWYARGNYDNRAD